MTLEELKQMIPEKQLPQIEKQANEDWINAPLSNNEVFINFCNNKKICKALVDILLSSFGVKSNNPTLVYEKTVNKSLNTKEVKFDMYVEDDFVIIDMEMQVVIKLFSPRRGRSYQAIIDVEQLKKCKNYNDIKDTYIIIICLEDPFGYGSPIYRIKKVPEPLNLNEFEEGEFKTEDYIEQGFDKNLFEEIEKLDKEELNKFLSKQKKRYKKKKCEEYIDGANILYFDASLFHKVKNKELRAFLGLVYGYHTKDCKFYHLLKHRFNRIKLNEEAKLNFMMSYFREYDREVLMAEKVNKKVRESITKEVTELVTKEVTEEVTNKVTKQVTNKVTSLVTKQVTEKERQKAYEKEVKIVVNMMKQNFDDEFIKNITNLSIEEIVKIREEYFK